MLRSINFRMENGETLSAVFLDTAEFHKYGDIGYYLFAQVPGSRVSRQIKFSPILPRGCKLNTNRTVGGSCTCNSGGYIRTTTLL